MRESDLLTHIARAATGQPAAYPHVIVPPGDDCAVVRIGGVDVLLKVDQVIEGKHFVVRPYTAEYLDLIARKAVARAMSDLAAMAGTPLAALAAVCLPQGFPTDAARTLADDVRRWGERWGSPVVGGDVATAAGPLALSITAVGVAHARRGPVLRRGATPGDGVYVTGAIGGSFGEDGMGRHLTFEPRLREAAFLADALGERLHAMLDISDGVGIDAARLAAASGVALVLDAAAIPLHTHDVLRAIADGEDYELMFTAGGAVPPSCPATGCPITRIGAVEPGAGSWLLHQGRRTDISSQGYEHR